MDDLGVSKEQIQEIAKENDVNVPILNYRIVGERIELMLYGGTIVSSAAGLPQSASQLEILPLIKLRSIATDLDIPGRSKMNRSELIEAILTAPS